MEESDVIVPSTGWWRESAIYQVYPRSFQDSDGDGDGDLRGVISRLEYLNNLGIDAIWLSPFYRTPNRDGGYDISDPRDVDPRFGTLKDAEDLISKAHETGLRVIFDIVPNHFSSEHRWFREALADGPGSAARKRFHFHPGRGTTGDRPPNNWCSVFGGSAWTRIVEDDGKPGEWYLHLFDSSQPDLNWDCMDVQRDFEETLKFWLDRGVDGFRVDVAHGLVKGDINRDHPDPEGLTRALRMDVTDISPMKRQELLSDIPFFDQEGVHEIFRKWRATLNTYTGERIFVAEAWVHPSIRATRYVRPDELHQIFNFDFMLVGWNGVALRKAIEKTMAEVETVGAPATWVLSNHDSPRVVSRLGDGLQGQFRSRALALLVHALPGAVYIYQGEELGLPDAELGDEDRRDPVFIRSNGLEKGRDGARVPMPWDSRKPSFGFTTGVPWLPMPSDWAKYAHQREHVDINQDEYGHLELYKRSISLRRKFSGLDLHWVEAPSGIIAFWRGREFLIVINTLAVEVHLPINTSNFLILINSRERVALEDDHIVMPPDSAVWCRRN